MDGTACGSLNITATEDELYADRYMQLIPIEYLLDEDTAHKNHVKNAYTAIRTLRPSAPSFFDFTLKERLARGDAYESYVGYERNEDRVCGTGVAKTVVPRGSVVFFGRVDDVSVDITNLLTGVEKGETYALPVGVAYHVQFAFYGVRQDEYVCPFSMQGGDRNEGAGLVRACFPGDVMVAGMQMHSLKVGDKVDDGWEGSDVFMFSHRDSATVEQFVRIETANGDIVTLSHGHLVHTADGAIPAGKLSEKDYVESVMGTVRVVRTRQVTKRGLFNPHTLSGRIVVGGVVCSCYTTAVREIVAHCLLAPLRAVYRVGRKWGYVRRGLEEWLRFGAEWRLYLHTFKRVVV